MATPPIPRWYQKEAIIKGVDFFHDPKQYNGLEILPTGSGKSVVIANVAKGAEGKTVIFQPSKEILEQNFSKYISYGYRAGIYSASGGMKFIDDVTFATIGSVARKHHILAKFKNIIIDECHLVNPEKGMYSDFIKSLDRAKVLGLTASPYRLYSDANGGMLRFLNRQSPRVFNKVLYYVQNKTLFDEGHLAPLEYFSFNVIDKTMLKVNATGTDFTTESLKNYYRKINLPAITADYANRLLAKRKNLIVFCTLVDEAQKVSAKVPGSVVITGETPADDRARLLAQFKAGRIRCVINVGVLTTGFDYPELECCLLAFSTMSLGKYYQCIGRIMRPHPNKASGWVVDLGGNIKKFGAIESLRVVIDEKGLYSIWNNDRQLTNVSFTIY